jgi:hypothetical protein
MNCPEGFEVCLGQAIIAKKKIGEDYCTVRIEHSWKIVVYAHPDEKNLHQVVAALTSLTGRLEKGESAGSICFEGANGFFEVLVVTPEQCKIVGYKTEQRAKKKEIILDEYETVRTPVTDCEVRTGKVKAGDFEPVPAEAP